MLYAKTLEEIAGPARIVFDLQAVEPLFHKKIAWMEQCEGDLTEVMHLLPAYINEFDTAGDGLNALLESVLRDHTQSDAQKDGEIYVDAIKTVAQHLMGQYYEQGLYRDNGICHYVFERWLDQQSPVFVKVTYEELYCD